MGCRDIHHLAVMADKDRAGLRQIVAVEAAQQRRLAGARRTAEDDAFARRDIEIQLPKHREEDISLRMQLKGLNEVPHVDGEGRGGHFHTQICRTDETRSWV